MNAYRNGGCLSCARCFRPISGVGTTVVSDDGRLTNYHALCIPIQSDPGRPYEIVPVVDPAKIAAQPDAKGAEDGKDA